MSSEMNYEVSHHQSYEIRHWNRQQLLIFEFHKVM